MKRRTLFKTLAITPLIPVLKSKEKLYTFEEIHRNMNDNEWLFNMDLFTNGTKGLIEITVQDKKQRNTFNIIRSYENIKNTKYYKEVEK
jgi:hypothetical protein